MPQGYHVEMRYFLFLFLPKTLVALITLLIVYVRKGMERF